MTTFQYSDLHQVISKKQTPHPVYNSGAEVEQVNRFKLLGMNIPREPIMVVAHLKLCNGN